MLSSIASPKHQTLCSHYFPNDGHDAENELKSCLRVMQNDRRAADRAHHASYLRRLTIFSCHYLASRPWPDYLGTLRSRRGARCPSLHLHRREHWCYSQTMAVDRRSQAVWLQDDLDHIVAQCLEFENYGHQDAIPLTLMAAMLDDSLGLSLC
jgi:hypothetical protein